MGTFVFNPQLHYSTAIFFSFFVSYDFLLTKCDDFSHSLLLYYLFQAGDKKKSRGMDNLRKSFRASLRRKKNKDGHHSSNSDKDFVRDRTGGKLKKISKKSKPERKKKTREIKYKLRVNQFHEKNCFFFFSR